MQTDSPLVIFTSSASTESIRPLHHTLRHHLLHTRRPHLALDLFHIRILQEVRRLLKGDMRLPTINIGKAKNSITNTE